MKIFSWNVNGIRAIHKKGELSVFIDTYSPDILCFQEIKANSKQIEFLEKEFPEYKKFYHSAEKAGYSGTGIWILKSFIKNSSISSLQFFSGFDKNLNFLDTEGRISRIDFSLELNKKRKDFSILGVYFPNGGKSTNAWGGKKGKLVFYDTFLKQVNIIRNAKKEVIFCGDVNTCHQEIDIARPKENDGKIGFHPLEREKISKWIHHNWIDVWREKNPKISGQYSWWSYRGGARKRNVGWRIDYFFVDKNFIPEISDIQYINTQMGSDHCPIMLEI